VRDIMKMNTAQEEKEDAKINLKDFATVVSIIDVCTKRGAFEGGELLLVGQLRQKFATFVDENAEAAKQAEAAQKQTLDNSTNQDDNDENCDGE